MVLLSRGSTGTSEEASTLLSVLIDDCRQFHDNEMAFLKSLDLPGLMDRHIKQSALNHQELLRRLDEIHSSNQPFCQHEAILTRLEMMDTRDLLRQFIAEYRAPLTPQAQAVTLPLSTPSAESIELLLARFQEQHIETMAKIESIDLRATMLNFAMAQARFQSEIRGRLDRIEQAGWWYQIKLMWNKILRRVQGDK
jgi:hypothetical protein